jgi:hypothetical protein
VVSCALLATGTIRATPDAVAVLRLNPGPVLGQALAASFLKHADEQTVVGLAAVLDAISKYDLTGTDFTNWGVLAAPRFLGRATLAVALQRFAVEGAWGVSPHLIPHRSMHAVSGTISQALAIHGPNFGVGGGPESACEMMMAAATIVTTAQVPGVWAVLTGWDPEPILEKPANGQANGHRHTGLTCKAVALALAPAKESYFGPSLRIVPSDYRAKLYPAGQAPIISLESLQDALEARACDAAWRLNCGGWVEIAQVPARGGAFGGSL